MEKKCKSSTGLRHIHVTVFLYHFAVYTVYPAITDITMAALCPGKNHCSLAIYLSGFQSAMIGVGTLVMMPLVGNLSDKYGRKALLTLPMALTIIPLAILAYSRSRNFFYAYFVIKTLTAMICEGSVFCLSLAYVADNVTEGGRASAFGVLSGIATSAYVCGTLSARFLSTPTTFQVSTSVGMAAAAYMRVFLPETVISGGLYTPILSEVQSDVITLSSVDDSNEVKQGFKQMPSVKDIIALLRSSSTLSHAAIVAFLSNLADVGLQTSVTYFFKARFGYNKNQFAELMVIGGVGGTVSQLLLMPMFVPRLGEEKLLSAALLFGCLHMFLYSIAWSTWVPYSATLLSVLYVLAQPCMRSIVSKQVGSNEQGKAQGCISGISSFAGVVSPLIFSPLTALALSEKAPINFPGFSIACAGLVMVIAFAQSIMIPILPPPNSKDGNCADAQDEP